MEKLTILSKESLDKYFNLLSYKGYYNARDTNNLLVLTFLEEFLFYKFSAFITENDYNVILKVLNSLYGSSSVIDYPEFNIYADSVNGAYSNKGRSTENNDIRLLSNNSIRIAL